MRATVSRVAQPFAVVLAVLLVAPSAFARTVRCESRNFRYRYCPVNTHGDVRLKREFSHSSCRYGRGWGYDHRGVWVDRGCRAEFAVDEGRAGRHSRYDYYDDDHDKGSKAAAAVAGVALGAAVAAAIAANKNKKHGDDSGGAPSWLVGRFVGYSTEYHNEVSLQVSPSGNVTAHLPGGMQANGVYSDGRISFGGTEYDLDRDGSGFTLTQHDDRSNVVSYQRDR